jgi:hypothetical protein
MRRIAWMALVVCALLVGGLVSPAQAAGDTTFGRLWASDRVLREGCHNYRYHYVVRPRTNDWIFETFLHAPSGRTIASNVMDPGANAKRGANHFRFCNDVTRPGRFKITGKLTWQTCNGLPGPANECRKHVRWVKPGSFRLRRP